MSHSRMSGQLQNSRTLNKIVYANQLGSIESGTNGGQLLYYTEEGIPTSSPNLTVLQNPDESGATVDITGNLNTGNLKVTDAVAVNGRMIQGPGAIGATGLDPTATVLSYHNRGRYVEIAAETTNNAYIDFHSNDTTLNNDYDARILSTGGGTGVDGGANLTIWANNTSVIGSQKTFGVEGYSSYPPGLSIPILSQFRQILTQKRVWTGSPIQGTTQRTTLTDQTTGKPRIGKYSISMGQGIAGGAVFSYDFYLFRVFPSSTFILFDYFVSQISRQGNNLDNFRADIERQNQTIPLTGPPQIWWTNTTSVPATYMVIFEGFVDDTGY